LNEVWLSPEGGLQGDQWAKGAQPELLAQLAVMQLGVAKLICQNQSISLFGDNLFLDADLSAEALPVGSKLRLGGATLEVSPKAHDGCLKFKQRFGADALRFVQEPATRSLNLRGIYLFVLKAGQVRIGDALKILP